MKKLEKAKKRFLIENGYGYDDDYCVKYTFENMSDEEKEGYVYDEKSQFYVRHGKADDVSPEEFELIWRTEMYKKVDQLEKNTKTIKYCNILFASLTVVSLLISIYLTSCLAKLFI